MGKDRLGAIRSDALIPRSVGWASLFSGVAAAIVLLCTGLLMARGQPFGTFAYGLAPLMYLPMPTIALALYRLGQPHMPKWSRLALALGILAALTLAVVTPLPPYALNVISLEAETLVASFALPALGIWMISANRSAHRSGALPRGLAWLGLVVGLIWVLALANAAFQLAGGSLVPPGWSRLPDDFLERLGTLAALGGAVLYRLWAILLGRLFLSGKVRLPEPTLAAGVVSSGFGKG